VHTRISLILALATLIFSASVATALAAPSGYDSPAPGAQLVSRQTASGTDAVSTALSTVDNVKVGTKAMTITVNDDSGRHSINLDYGDLSTDKRTVGVGGLAIGYMALGALTRLVRLLRAAGLVG